VPITKDSVKALLEKLEHLKYEYLEKEREAAVLRKNLEDTRDSLEKALAVKD
jgi:hypothetical protein